MELTSNVDRTARFHIVAPLFFNDEIIGVLNGKYVQGSVARKALTAYRLEQRTSFKHPIVGLLLGIVMIGMALPLLLWGLALGSLYQLGGSAFALLCGLSLLWGVIRRRDEPWIVFITASGERAFPIRGGLSPQAVGVLKSLAGDPAVAGKLPHAASKRPAPR